MFLRLTTWKRHFEIHINSQSRHYKLSNTFKSFAEYYLQLLIQPHVHFMVSLQINVQVAKCVWSHK